MRNFDIPMFSELNIIDKYAFLELSITCLTIPPHLTFIADTAFRCLYIQIIEFAERSNIRYFDLSTLTASEQVMFMVPNNK